MSVANIRWWQWPLIGLFFGSCLWFVNAGPAEPVNDRTIEQRQMEQDILRPPADPNHPWVTNLVVYPPFASAVGQGKVMVVRFDELVPKPGGKPNEYEYEHCWAHTPIPYSPTVLQPAVDPNNRQLIQQLEQQRNNPKYLPPGIWKIYSAKPSDNPSTIAAAVYGVDTAAGETLLKSTNRPLTRTLIRLAAGQPIFVPWPPQSGKTALDWLAAARADFPWVHYRFAWWAVPQNAMILWIGGTTLLIGVIWPIVFELLMRAGLGPERAPRAPREKAARRVASPEDAPKPILAAVMSAADEEQLRALEASLEASLRAAATEHPAEEEEEEAPAPVVQLFNRPLEPAATVPDAPAEEIEVGGEFYPVVRGYHPRDPKATIAQPASPEQASSARSGPALDV